MKRTLINEKYELVFGRARRAGWFVLVWVGLYWYGNVIMLMMIIR